MRSRIMGLLVACLVMCLFVAASTCKAQFFRQQQQQCGPQGCPPGVTYIYPQTYTPVVNGTPVVTYSPPVVAQQPTPKAEEPKPEPKKEERKVEALPPTGVDRSKLGEQPSYHSAEGEITRRKAFSMVENSLEDNSKKVRVTIIGKTEDRKKALEALPKDIDRWAVVKAYDSSDWLVREQGFVTTGSPTVYCQAPNGDVIHRQDDLKDLEAAIQKADPNYDPNKDPDLRKKPDPKPDDSPLLGSWSVPTWAWCVAAGAVGLFGKSILALLSGLAGRVFAPKDPALDPAKVNELIELLRKKDQQG